MQFSLLGRLMQRLDRIEDAITQNARRMDRGVLPPADSTGPTPTLMPGPDDISTLLERLLPLIEKLQGPRAPTAIPADLQQPEQLRKALDLIKTILVPGADGKPPPLGQVNGALGQTIGNLLNGKKTAIGLLGAVITPMLTQASDDHRARSHSRHADTGGRARALHPADLPRADRLGRARQDGEMVPRHRAAASESPPSA